MIFARCNGLATVLTYTAQPSRICSVHAAAYPRTALESRFGAVPMTCSVVQAPSKPSSSARLRYRRSAAGSKAPSGTSWGIEIAI
jgi:hypothetical protein